MENRFLASSNNVLNVLLFPQANLTQTNNEPTNKFPPLTNRSIKPPHKMYIKYAFTEERDKHEQVENIPFKFTFTVTENSPAKRWKRKEKCL